MSFEADFFKVTDVIQETPSANWTWEMADINSFMVHDVVPRQANQTVAVTGRTISTDDDLNPVASFTVTLTPAPGLLTFMAIRIPAS